MAGRAAILFGWAGLVLVGCAASREAPPACSSGATAPCVCTSGTRGTETCAVGAFGVCSCAGSAGRCTSGTDVACACTDGGTGLQHCTASGVFGTCHCGGGPGPACTPGATMACTCSTGSMGAEVCDAAGTFAPCLCDPPACVPGASAACTCTDATSGAQTCDDTGAFAPCVCDHMHPVDAHGLDAGPTDAFVPDAPRPDAYRSDTGPRPDGGCGACAPLGVHCGSAIDSCGAVLSCGACSATTRSLVIDANDIAYDPSRDLVFASIAGSAGVRGNSLVAIDPASAAIVWSTFVGSEPTVLALDADRHRIWVGLTGANAVRSVDLDTHAAGAMFALGTGSFGDALVPGALAALPSGGLVVSRMESGGRYYDSLAVYDDGVMRPTTRGSFMGRGGDSIVAITDTTVVGFNNQDTGFDLTRFGIGTSGVVSGMDYSSLIDGFSQTISFDGAYVVGSSGQVVDPRTMTRSGTCTPMGGGSTTRGLQGSVGDAATNRVYGALGGTFSGDPISAIIACDHTTFTEVARITPSGIHGPIVRSVLLPGVGLAMLSQGDSFDHTASTLWFVATNLVAGP